MHYLDSYLSVLGSGLPSLLQEDEDHRRDGLGRGAGTEIVLQYFATFLLNLPV